MLKSILIEISLAQVLFHVDERRHAAAAGVERGNDAEQCSSNFSWQPALPGDSFVALFA